MNADACTIEIHEYISESPAAAGAVVDIAERLQRQDYAHSVGGADDAETMSSISWRSRCPTAKSGADDAETMSSISIDSGLAWVRDGLQRIAQLGSLGPDWHESDCAPPNSLAVRLAGHVFRKLSKIEFQPSSIDPSADEGISISFARRNRTANVECFNTGEIYGATLRRGGEPYIFEMTDQTILAGLARIYEFVGD